MTKTVTHIDCPKEWESTNDWDSHRPLLYISLVNSSQNTVLEFGCGEGSTELILFSSKNFQRPFYSFETNPEYAEKFKEFGVIYVDDYLSLENFTDKANVVFVDAAPAEARKGIINIWKDKSDIIVVHDSEPGAEYVYGLSEILSTFKYRLDYQPEGKPHTTAVSNFIDVTKWVE